MVAKTASERRATLIKQYALKAPERKQKQLEADRKYELETRRLDLREKQLEAAAREKENKRSAKRPRDEDGSESEAQSSQARKKLAASIEQIKQFVQTYVLSIAARSAAAGGNAVTIHSSAKFEFSPVYSNDSSAIVVTVNQSEMTVQRLSEGTFDDLNCPNPKALKEQLQSV